MTNRGMLVFYTVAAMLHMLMVVFEGFLYVVRELKRDGMEEGK